MLRFQWTFSLKTQPSFWRDPLFENRRRGKKEEKMASRARRKNSNVRVFFFFFLSFFCFVFCFSQQSYLSGTTECFYSSLLLAYSLKRDLDGFNKILAFWLKHPNRDQTYEIYTPKRDDKHPRLFHTGYQAVSWESWPFDLGTKYFVSTRENVKVINEFTKSAIEL